MDFTVTYDPNVFEPVGVTAGTAASAADKSVQYNLLEPGRCKVVMMGLNQSVVSSGEVATLSLRRLTDAGGTSDLGIAEPTFSDLNAASIPSKGSTETIDFTNGETHGKDPTEGETPGDGTQEPGNGNPKPTEPTAPGVATPGSPTTTPPTTGNPAPGTVTPGQNVLPGVMPLGAGKALKADPKDPALKNRMQQMARMGDLSQLPAGVRPGIPVSPGASPETLGTAGAQSETSPGTPGAHVGQVGNPAGTARPGLRPVGALAMNTAGGPGQVATPSVKTTASAPAASVATHNSNLKWLGVAGIALALGVLFVLRRRLFS
jgi:hypothetical protein